MATHPKDLIVALDIGTSKVLVLVAEAHASEGFHVIGKGQVPSEGIKRGVVVDIDATVRAIQEALKEAELMADCRIGRVSVGITGAHLQGSSQPGMVAIKSNEVSAADVARVIETATAISVPNDRTLLLVKPQEFRIDQQEVKEPVGMSGVRLEAKVHIVTGSLAAAENVRKCVRRCGLEPEHLALHPHASAQAVLTADEMELGVVCIDIGAGTTDVAVYTGGAIRHTASLPIAGDLITNDIAMALRTPTRDAEELKLKAGVAKQLLASPDEQVEVPGLGDRPPRMLSKQALAGVIEPRIEEIFALVLHEVRESRCEELISSGVVLTGGAALMPGMVELAEDVFFKPARVGLPLYDARLADVVRNPAMSTALGLLTEARQRRAQDERQTAASGFGGSLLDRLKDYVRRNF
jgi:cell division protein FtsA